jgi:hypothetical protein
MISPWARKAWEIDHDQRAYETLITAAETLATRYNAKTKCLRSWDTCVTKRYSFIDPSVDFLVIIVRIDQPGSASSCVVSVIAPADNFLGQHA